MRWMLFPRWLAPQASASYLPHQARNPARSVAHSRLPQGCRNESTSVISPNWYRTAYDLNTWVSLNCRLYFLKWGLFDKWDVCILKHGVYVNQNSWVLLSLVILLNF